MEPAAAALPQTTRSRVATWPGQDCPWLGLGGLQLHVCKWHKTGGRNEHLVQAVKGGRKALSTTWRGSYSGICAVMRLTAHMVALQERMAGPRYDCYGPWAMCPADIVAQFA